MRARVGAAIVAVCLLAACQSPASETVAGNRGFLRGERFYALSCSTVRDDRLGAALGSVRFEMGSLDLRTVTGVPDDDAVAARWGECDGPSEPAPWVLAVAGAHDQGVDVSPYREVLAGE